MARNWREIRAEAVAQGRVDPARADAARRRCTGCVQQSGVRVGADRSHRRVVAE